VPGAPVVDKRGSLRGSVDLVALVAADQAAKVGDLALDRTFVSADDSLDDVLESSRWPPVMGSVVANDRLTGILSRGTWCGIPGRAGRKRPPG